MCVIFIQKTLNTKKRSIESLAIISESKIVFVMSEYGGKESIGDFLEDAADVFELVEGRRHGRSLFN